MLSISTINLQIHKKLSNLL